MALGDTFIPSIETSATSSTGRISLPEAEYTSAINRLKKIPARNEVEIPQRYLEENASSIPGFRDALQRTLGEYVREEDLKGMRVILSALE